MTVALMLNAEPHPWSQARHGVHNCAISLVRNCAISQETKTLFWGLQENMGK